MIIDTSKMSGGESPFDTYQIYNGLDCCLTWEIHQVLSDTHPEPNIIYDFERAMQAPALEMMLRGIKVDRLARDTAVAHLSSQVDQLDLILQKYSQAIWSRPLNPRSPAQLKELFYKVMGFPEQHEFKKGERKVSTSRDALEKLKLYFHAKPLVSCILAIRDLKKQIEFLRSGVDLDGRIRTSYNVAGTETGRWSSSENAFGTGANLQNFPDKLRKIFISDEGRKLAYLDLEQAESWIVGIKVGLLFGDWSYVNAIRSGDLHTTVARMVWPDLPWTGDIKRDRAVAERPFYRDFSYRDMAKRGGHGTNYYGKPPTMAKHLKVQTKLMEAFQDAYFSAFPGIRHWHHWVAQQLQIEQSITTLLGRRRHFFGRPNDDSTLREAIAFEPQSCVGDLLNLAAWRTWAHGGAMDIRLLAQLHDAILIDYPDIPEREDEVSSFMLPMMRTPLNLGGQTFVIPNDFSSGWNWGKFDPKSNPAGLKKRRPNQGVEDRARPEMSRLDRVFPSFH